MISKPKLLFFMITNCLLVILCVGQFLYFGADLTLTKRLQPFKTEQTAFLTFNIAVGILAVIIYIGLFIVMRALGEAKWRISGLYVFFGAKVVAVVFPIMILNIEALHYNVPFVFRVNYLIGMLCYLYINFTLILGRSSRIRSYYSIIGGLGIILQLIALVIERLYRGLGLQWANLDIAPFFTLIYVVTLMMFVEVYKKSLDIGNEASKHLA